MQKILLFNTLGRVKQEFVPIDMGEVRMYSCGPTVYNYLHIGNLRAYLLADTLKRMFQYNGYKVKHVMNVTDIGHIVSDADIGEDKMVSALLREGKPMTLGAMREIADFYFGKAKEDMDKMNIIQADENPFASDNIKEDIDIIESLLAKNIAYKTSSAIYFDTAKIENYGKLGGTSNGEAESRIEANNEKKDSRDFALWKFSDDSGIGFEAPFGKGFPGWHIECSAMGLKYLGDTFDIHIGGIDLAPVHHNNEIAQSESYTGKRFVNYWVHNEHITIGEAKMAKSDGNFITLNTLGENGIHSLAYRYWLLTARYSTRIDYSIDAIKAAQTAYERLHDAFDKLGDAGIPAVVRQPQVLRLSDYRKRFLEAINDDLDTPKALSIAWELVKDSSVTDPDKRSTLLDFDRVLGLMLGSLVKEKLEISGEVQVLLDERKKAREAKDWAKADDLRMAINKAGFEVKDTDSGQELTKL